MSQQGSAMYYRAIFAYKVSSESGSRGNSICDVIFKFYYGFFLELKIGQQ
jgi:hypothetical protein